MGLSRMNRKLSCPVLRGPGSRKAAWLLGSIARASPRDIATVASASCTGDGTGSKTWFYARSTVLARRRLSIGPVTAFRFTIAKRVWLNRPRCS